MMMIKEQMIRPYIIINANGKEIEKMMVKVMDDKNSQLFYQVF